MDSIVVINENGRWSISLPCAPLVSRISGLLRPIGRDNVNRCKISFAVPMRLVLMRGIIESSSKQEGTRQWMQRGVDEEEEDARKGHGKTRGKRERENTLNKSAAKLVRRKSRDLFCLAGLSFLAPTCPEIIGKRKPWTAYHSRRTMWIIRVGGVERANALANVVDRVPSLLIAPRMYIVVHRKGNERYWVEVALS